MPKAKPEKFIDLNQFPHKNGKISWKDSVGKRFYFTYNGEDHYLDILRRINRNHFDIKVDNFYSFNNFNKCCIISLCFDSIFYKPVYKYQIGDIVNGCIIQNRYSETNENTTTKYYVCKCIKDDYEFTREEYYLSAGHGCPVCAGKIVVKGINDIATTDPDLVPLFVNIQDAYTHSRKSGAKVEVRCPYCGSIKLMTIYQLTGCRVVTCDKCLDSISYPNKFAHELFEQLQNQYALYIAEYCPDWAGNYKYDNYIELLDGQKIIVEMDGGFHYKEIGHVNDTIKNKLAADHQIVMIRVNCYYDRIDNRYSFIKENVVKNLNSYFNLSNIDWEKCHRAGIESQIIYAIEYYNTHPKMSIPEIGKQFHVSDKTMHSYLNIGEGLGLCQFIRNDPNRIRNSKPIAMYDADLNLIGIYKSSKQIQDSFPELDFKSRSIRESITKGRQFYKGYHFKYATYEEYQNY